MTDLAAWLRHHDLSKYLSLFLENDVDFATLLILTESDLEQLGLPFGARKRLLAALKATTDADAPREERRQLTVLFCDIVGYTELAARHDPEIITAMVRGYEDLCAACVSRYEGYLFQRMGDGIVAFFGYPLAHEREAERAIRAGLDILHGARGLEQALDLRIGIATGIVLVSGGGQMAVGDAMNLAARLQAEAEPRQMVVSSTVRKLAGPAFHYAPLGDVALKGFPKPVPIYRVEGPSEVQAGPPAPAAAASIGRDEELSGLVAVWQRVCMKRLGSIAGISGEPGIGKSRIAEDLCQRIVRPENRLIRFQCSPFHLATPLFPVISHLENELGFGRGMEAEERLSRIESLVCGRHGLPPGDVRFIAALLSVPFTHRFGHISEAPRIAKVETLRILLAMIASAASRAPAVLLFEDLHWADATTCEALDLLVSKLEAIAVFVVATYRPEFTPRWAGREGCDVLALQRLSPERSREMLLRCTGGRALPLSIETMIIEKTDGIPLFIEELIRTVIESGQLRPEGDRYVQAGETLTITLPDTLRDSLTARLDRMDKAKRVAQIGAVVGRSFSRDFLQALGGLDAPQLDEGLAQLVSSGLAQVEKKGSAQNYVFKHALVQDAAYDSLLLSQRRTLHGRVAERLTEQDGGLIDRQPELIAHHLSAAGADAKAVPLWLKAADVAMQRFAVNEAASHLRKGLAQIAAIAPGPERDLLELRYRAALGPVLVAERGWGHPELSTVLEPAWTLAASLSHRPSYLPILNALWVHYMSIDKLSHSNLWAERLVRLGEQLGDSDLTIVGHRALSGSAYWQGRLSHARHHGDILRGMYDADKHWHVVLQTNTDPLTGESIYRGLYLWMLGYPDQAVAVCNERDAHARRRGHPFDLAFSLTLGAQLFDFLSMPDELERRAEEANAVGRRYGVTLFFEMMSEITRGVAWLRAGLDEEAEEQIGRSVSRLAATGHGVWISYLRALRGEALARLGRLAEAAQVMDESIAHIEKGEERCHFAEVLRLRGWVSWLMDEREMAEGLLRRSIAFARAQEARSWELRSATTLANLLGSGSRRDEAISTLAPVHDWFSEGFETFDLREANWLLGNLRDGSSLPGPEPIATDHRRDRLGI